MTFEKANFLEVAVLGVPQGWGEEGSHGEQRKGGEQLAQEGAEVGVP